MGYIRLTVRDLYKQLTYLSILSVTLFGTFVIGDIKGSKRTLEQDEHRIAFLQGIIKQEYTKLQVYSLVANSALEAKEEAEERYTDLMEKILATSDATCAISATYRAAAWKLTNVGLWNKYLHIRLATTVTLGGVITPMEETQGHLVFVFQDTEGNTRAFSNHRGTINLGKIGTDPMVIAKALYKKSELTVLEARFEE